MMVHFQLLMHNVSCLVGYNVIIQHLETFSLTFSVDCVYIFGHIISPLVGSLYTVVFDPLVVKITLFVYLGYDLSVRHSWYS